MWQAEDGSLVYSNRGHSYGVTAVAWSPNGTCIASGGFEGRVQVFYAKDGRHVYTYRGPYMITALTWSPDSRCLAFGDDLAACRCGMPQMEDMPTRIVAMPPR